MFRKLVLLGVAAALGVSACSKQETPENKLHTEVIPMTIQVTSSAFSEGQMIPARYARKGENVSPPLAWTNVPAGTQSFALIVDDPDAPVGDWVHWIVFNLPPDTTSLPEGIKANADLPGQAVQGKNGWGETGYGGPQPPSGTHRYIFSLYALDTLLPPDSNVTKADLWFAMEGHILAGGELMGKYSK
jgi:Raf kinase inhibitor-like YbhB/YbcL family protein